MAKAPTKSDTPTPSEDVSADALQQADKAAPDAKAERGEEVGPPAWQKAEYDGPMTCEQAEWRNKNLAKELGHLPDDAD